ncbi:prepilin-type N-terminal cleavage/methylation domain-containing protein [Sphingomonas flavalba]|uniref:prepilin-type N-terminal cleavage/methylation domain-containing protein n=1 Tax=Sphingomonas flavalba TaxID=2559804 RepID=UPI00109DC61E|nr:prepilin-type N-terminal cleavage/methylation domain-containing protein [Sphingomonas flavalba]
MRPAPAERGLTLVEMLVVLAIIGIASGIAVLGFGSGRGVNVQAEARTLAARLSLAADIEMVQDRRLLIAWDDRGYSFLGWNPNTRRWLPETGNSLAGRHIMPQGFRFAVDGASPAPLASDGTGRGIVARISDGGQAWQVLFDGFVAVAVPAPVEAAAATT